MRRQDWAFFGAVAAALLTVTLAVRGALVAALVGVATTAAS